MNPARLIALDWGTSNLRASLLGDGGQVLQTRAGASGVMAVPQGRFAVALLELCGDWIAQHACPLIASGMVGSRQGWHEVPYLECPATLAQAARQMARVEVKPQVVLHIVPGLCCVGSDGQDDVMRGEETQIWGAGLDDGSCVVLPGTHSKWAWTGAGAVISGFATYMTGELYALLTQHGILGRLMSFGEDDAEAFARGVQLGLADPANIMHSVFAARTAGLMQRMAPTALPDFLSGMLIGAEIAGASARLRPDHVTLIGDTALNARYAAALKIAGIHASPLSADATTRGQWQLALQAGLLENR